MSKLFIDDRAIEFIKKALAKENAPAMRIFISGGGCCKQFEMAPVKKALAGDVTFTQDWLTVHIEKGLADNTEYIGIKFDEQRGLLVELE
jgi:Fe-S cluster assembly iron-binding protein IscA